MNANAWLLSVVCLSAACSSGVDSATSAGDTSGTGTDPFAAPEGCASMETWQGGEEPWNGLPPSAMHPGAPCIDCHQNPYKYGADELGPPTWIAGTVYSLGHETDECFGIDGKSVPVTVEVTDANGKVISLTVGPTGNFILEKKGTTVAFPIQAKVVSANGERAMAGEVSSGDCNSCHTVTGVEPAPGRIVAP